MTVGSKYCLNMNHNFPNPQMMPNMGMGGMNPGGPNINLEPPPHLQPPMQSIGPPIPNPKKKRRVNSQHTMQQAPQPNMMPQPPQSLLPPPLVGYGDTIVASNPFDDTPQQLPPVYPQHPPPQMEPSPMRNMNQVPPMNGINPLMSRNPNETNALDQMNPRASNISLLSQTQVYPPNQPMVFNPQNPNAPPIYPCGICHKEVHDNDQAILCESGCNFWFHRSCTGLCEAAFQLLTQEVYAEWVCDKCLQSKNIPLVKFKP